MALADCTGSRRVDGYPGHASGAPDAASGEYNAAKARVVMTLGPGLTRFD